MSLLWRDVVDGCGYELLCFADDRGTQNERSPDENSDSYFHGRRPDVNTKGNKTLTDHFFLSFFHDNNNNNIIIIKQNCQLVVSYD